MESLPLIPLPLSAPFAWRAGKIVSRGEFLAQVLALSAELPTDRPVLNLCEDRYLFTLGLLAAVHGNLLSLLPNSTAPENIAALHALHPDLICLHDRDEAPFGLPAQRVTAPECRLPPDTSPPLIPAGREFARVFTSGSTGTPQPHAKTFGRVVSCTRHEGARLWQATGTECTVIGTVPFQHMYGLESTVFMPVFGNGILTCDKPFFPADIAETLAGSPAPRFLVTTPYHLRTLLDAGLVLPPLAGILSATAPLSQDLAHEAETRLDAPMLEIYGSTETGQLATRRPTQETLWTLFPDVRLTVRETWTRAEGGHLESPQQLGDLIELAPDGRFRLLGRHSDMINIAGKRSSLAFLNHLITTLPGVRDGAFCLPDEGDDTHVARLAAFVVAPGMNAGEILSALRQHLDAVFLPRPLVFVDVLPRNATGKIPAAAMQTLIATHLKGKR